MVARAYVHVRFSANELEKAANELLAASPYVLTADIIESSNIVIAVLEAPDKNELRPAIFKTISNLDAVA